MSATRQVINSLNPVRPKVTSLEVERENFEKSQQSSILKAINDAECPVKEKHVRSKLLLFNSSLHTPNLVIMRPKLSKLCAIISSTLSLKCFTVREL